MNHIGFKVNLATYLGLKEEAKKRKITLTEVCRDVLTKYIEIKPKVYCDKFKIINQIITVMED